MPAETRESVHFWTRREDAAAPWHPDEEPERFADAYGHAFLELHRRLAMAGMPVTIGPDPAPGSTAVVVSFEELANYQPQVPPRLMARLALSVLSLRRMPRVVLLRVDAALDVRPPAFTTLEVMPTRAAVSRPRQVWLPLLPQRGMLPRDPDRDDRLQTVVIKAFSYNVPEWADDRFADALRELGMTLRIDTEESGRWPDFGDVDVVLCTQRLRTGHPDGGIDGRRKPPTKVMNAWRAGAIPICGDYPGYREVAAHRRDALFAEDGAEACLAALRTLREDPELVERMRREIASRAQEYAPERTLDRTWQAVAAADGASRAVVLLACVRALAAEAVHRLRRAARRSTGG